MIRLLLLILIFNFSIHAQDNEDEISVDDQRNDAINTLIEQIKLNKGIYISQDKERLQKFITRVEQRTTLLNDAKAKLNNEQNRNKRLESAFENNEKILADLEEKLQIKIGVLGELFGVARQYAGELAAANENSVIFYEYPERQKILKELAIVKVHNISELEN
jgi:biopolymer transport protein ExbB